MTLLAGALIGAGRPALGVATPVAAAVPGVTSSRTSAALR
jgi:hypothetical protein